MVTGRCGLTAVDPAGRLSGRPAPGRRRPALGSVAGLLRLRCRGGRGRWVDRAVRYGLMLMRLKYWVAGSAVVLDRVNRDAKLSPVWASPT